MDVHVLGTGEGVAWFCATIFDMAADVGNQFFHVDKDDHL